MSQARKPPLAFIDEYGQANLDVTSPDVGTHFILTAVLVEDDQVDEVRAAVEAVRAKHFQTGELRAKKLSGSPGRFRKVLDDLNAIPFKFYAIVVDKREIERESGLSFKDSFYKFFSGLLYRELFAAHADLKVTADEYGREEFMDGLQQYLVKNYRSTLFDRPTVTFASSKDEPLVQLADIICGVLARTYDQTKTTEKSAELLALIRHEHALLITEWPVRYRAASGTGSLLSADPADAEIARYSIQQAEAFIIEHDSSADETVRAQLLVVKKLLYEVRFNAPQSYISTQDLKETLEAFGEARSDQWLRSTVIARLRDAGVLISSSHQGGYKIPLTVAEVGDFVAVTDTVVHPMLNRVARARQAVLRVTSGRVDVLGGDRLALLRAAVDAVGQVTRSETHALRDEQPQPTESPGGSD